MVPLPFSVLGYRFEKGLEILREGFDSAMAGVIRKNQDIQAELIEYKRSLENGGQWIGQNDDDGQFLWDQETLLEMDLDKSADAVAELRKAFVLAMYHFWERSIRTYCETEEFGHNALVKDAESKGIAIARNLRRIQRLANVLKHNTSDLGNKLKKSWPDVFPAGFQPNTSTDWYAAVALTDAHVGEAFDVILSSGPRSRRNGRQPW